MKNSLTNIRSLLVANRSEIAVRILKTAKKMKIRTAVLFEEKDKNSIAVQIADLSFGGEKIYTDQSKIIEVMVNNNIDAVHPGYGFLSENYEFAEKVEKAGKIFIGPSSDAIKKMGDKIFAKETAKQSNMPIMPGFDIKEGEKISDIELEKKILEIKLPVIYKAAYGGGGKGMSIVKEENKVVDEFRRIQEEAKRLFGNSGVLVEKYIEKNRHIEVQILGNYKGENFVISDRDCSVQRNNQKIIEEAPAKKIPSEVREMMHRSAETLANTVKYQNAGTIEFLYDDNEDQFYLLEMNTRLQVEHTVTEMITDLDLVEEQIKIADGIYTTYEKKNSEYAKHSMELRICAETPDNKFEPSTGKITYYKMPKENDSIRIDSGIKQGSTISASYDNMMLKLIVTSSTRKKAIKKSIQALEKMVIIGVHTNIPFLKNILENDDYKNHKIYTRYLQENEIQDQERNKLEEVIHPLEITANILYQLQLNQGKKNYRELFSFDNVKYKR